MKTKALSKAGGLRHRVTFRELVVTTDPWGGPVQTWNDVFTTWGDVEYLSGGEYWAARQSQSDIEGRVRIRRRDNINVNMRMVYDGRELEILSIVPYDAKRTELHVLFKEKLDG